MTDSGSDFDELFHAHYDSLVRYLTHQLADRDAAEELAQETFVRALRSAPKINQRAWLFTVATNLVRDQGRRETRERKRLAELHNEQCAALRERIQESQAREREPTPLHQALTTLGERDRSALLMSHEGLNYAEIAVALDLSPQSVGTTLSRARRKLMQQLESLTSANA